MSALSHFNEKGEAHMVDVSQKNITSRSATAQAIILMDHETLDIVLSKSVKKGDVEGIARLAGIMGAKKTSDLIPLCHPLPLSKVSIDIIADTKIPGLRIISTVKTTAQTGVEMEALTAASITSLTVYDMLKAVQKSIEIQSIKLLRKTGGKSGIYEVEAE